MTRWNACHNLPGWNPSRCCDSCHVDWEEYDMEMIEIYGGTADDLQWHLCCRANEWFDYAWEGAPPQWSQAANPRRLED